MEIWKILRGIKVETEEGYKRVLSNTSRLRKNKSVSVLKIRGEYIKFSNQKFIINNEEMYGKYGKIGDKIKTKTGDVLIEEFYKFPYCGVIHSLKVDSIKSNFYVLDDIPTYS